MKVKFQDFNNAADLMRDRHSEEWAELATVLESLKLHVKASDQSGLGGEAQFDPKGINAAISQGLTVDGWSKAQIPSHLAFLGKDVDFTKRGVVMEAQFSNYPFALNNIVRTTILIAEKAVLKQSEISCLVLVTKAKMFPAAQSTLYYEQAVSQMEALTKYRILEIPTRVVGLYEEVGATVEAVWTEYTSARYARAVRSQRVVPTKLEARSVRNQTACRIVAAITEN